MGSIKECGRLKKFKMKSKQQLGLELINQFEFIRDEAELKALSELLQQRPLSDSEYKRMMELGKKVLGGLK